MNYSKQEVTEYILSEDIKFVKLAFCDVFGVQKNISVLSGEIKKAFESGIAIDASAITGFGSAVHSDLFLRPDPHTLSVLPWRPEHGRVVRMFCDITYADGTPFENDTRNILKKAVSAAAKSGIEFRFSSRLEFYLFKTDEFGNPTKQPYDTAGYMDIAPEDKGENVRREICLTLEQMGITPEFSHHEEGPGQNEIDFAASDPVVAADNAITYKSVVRTVAARNGLYADFSPKPLVGNPGNGFHIGFSVFKDGKNVTRKAIAGVLSKVDEMTAFLNPTANSYERLGRWKAPKYIAYSLENYSQLMRVFCAGDEIVKAVLRSPDSSANPYLAFALIVFAGMQGVDNNFVLPQPCSTDLNSGFKEENSDYKALPASIDEAKKVAKSGFADKVLPRMLTDVYFK